MKVGIYTLYWDNVDPRIPLAQKAVFDALQLPVIQHRIHGLDHGEWIDWVMARMDDTDAYLFIDIDCIPLSKERVVENLQASAASGLLIGAEGAANHLNPNKSYTGAWYTYIPRHTWNALGRPTAKASPTADVCQTWTDQWRMRRHPVQLIAPTSCIIPKYDLPGRKMAYGIGTTYADECFHLFESRLADPMIFLNRCREITGKSTPGS